MNNKPKMSVSVTLGKASQPHGANVEHNNREFIPDNVDTARIENNIYYIQQDVRDAYDELFGASIEEYNSTQKRNDRKIHDYYKHISEGSREEAFYEIVVQFSDCKVAPVESKAGELTRQMLDEYMRDFQKRNSRIHVFNATLHADKASFHLHINFIPFYTEPRQRGLKRGVSMKAALIEQGFIPENKNTNQVMLWQENERKIMEQILNKHGIERDIKNANYEHMTVDEYKASEDEKKLPQLARRKALSPEQLAENNVLKLTEENALLKIENEKLVTARNSIWKCFYYSDTAKQLFVQRQLEASGIPFRETESGFEAQEIYVEEIRKLEKQYKPDSSSKRDVLRNTIDRFMLRTGSVDALLSELEKAGIEVKRGKYIAVKTPDNSQFIRLKSLGEEYTEMALQRRFRERYHYEVDINKVVKASAEKEPDSLQALTLSTVQTYIFHIAKGSLLMRKINKKKPFTWTNDPVLDKLSELNKKLNAGVTLDGLRSEFMSLEERISETEKRIEHLMFELEYYNANHKDELYDLRQSLTADYAAIKDVSETITAFEQILNGTYVRNLVELEKKRKIGTVANGLVTDSDKFSDRIIADEKPVEVVPVKPNVTESHTSVQDYIPRRR